MCDADFGEEAYFDSKFIQKTEILSNIGLMQGSLLNYREVVGSRFTYFDEDTYTILVEYTTS